MKRHVLIDTNVLVTAVDLREQHKAVTAAIVVSQLARTARGVVTPQVIGEYFNATTRSRGGQKPIFSPREASESSEEILAAFVCVDLTADTIQNAMRAVISYQMHINDAHIWAAARLNGITTILTEDGQSQAVIEGVRYVDPFAANFALSQIGL